MRGIASGMKAYCGLKGNDCRSRKTYTSRKVKEPRTGVRRQHLTGERKDSEQSSKGLGEKDREEDL